MAVIPVPPLRRVDPRFAPGATEHVVIGEDDLHGNVPSGRFAGSNRTRDRKVSAHFRSQANR
jgi:hypothetical protein